MSLRDDINVPVVIVLGLVTGLIVAVAIVGTQAGYNYVRHAELERNYDNAEANGTLSFGKQVWAPQEKALHDPEPKWMDVEKTTVHQSIDKAKQMFINAKGSMPAPRRSGDQATTKPNS